MKILDRVKIRLPDEGQVDELFLADSIQTVEDRLNLILGTDIIPEKFESIVVDAVVKVWRKRYHEGIKSESVDTLNTSFIDNVLDEYDKEINAYLQSQNAPGKNVVRFI